MKYMKGYQRFVNESKKAIEKNSMIVEKQVLSDFSEDFWNLCLKSSVFTNEEKLYIKDNLSDKKVSLLNEEWDWLNKAVDWAKDKGEKMFNFVKDKIEAVKNGLKDFVVSMISFAKNILTSGLQSAMRQATKFKAKVSGDGKIKKQVQEMDPEKAGDEVSNLVKTLQFYAPGKKASEAKPNFDKIGPQIEAKLKSAEGTAISSAEKNLSEAEAEAQNESIKNIINSTNDDVLLSFYNLSFINEAEEAPAKEAPQKTTGQKCVDWFLGFIGQEGLDPEAKSGAKLFWWGKLFLRILATCLSPILKVVEVLIKTGSNAALKTVSRITKFFGGPPADKEFYEFILLGGLCAGVVGIVYDALMIADSAFLGADNFSVIKAWFAKAINNSLDLFPDYKALKSIFAYFCAAMTLWHVLEEMAHLGILKGKFGEFFGGHGDHGHGEHKEGEEAKPGEKPAPAAKPGEKPAPGGAPAPAAA